MRGTVVGLLRYAPLLLRLVGALVLHRAKQRRDELVRALPAEPAERLEREPAQVWLRVPLRRVDPQLGNLSRGSAEG